GAQLGSGLFKHLEPFGGVGDLGAGVECGNVGLQAVDGGDAFDGREFGGVVEPDGKYGFVGGTEEAGFLAIQDVVEGGQFASHVRGVAFGIGLGALGGKADQSGGLAQSDRAGSDDLEEEVASGDLAT